MPSALYRQKIDAVASSGLCNPLATGRSEIPSCLLLALSVVLLASGGFARSAQASSEAVLIDETGFSPATLTIHQGDEILWFNGGNEAHTTTAVGGEWDSRRIAPDEFYSVVLTRLGTFAYICALHIGETGVVTVLPAVPEVSVFAPLDGTRYGQPATFPFQVIASDSDGSVRQVCFLDGGDTLGADAVSPYELTMMNLSSGSHLLSAEATDNSGYVGTSAPVNITITEPPGGAVWNVDIQGARFIPGQLHVAAGDTVVFRNLDSSNHTATGVFASREALCGSTVLDAAHSCTNAFLVPGSYSYFCGLHPFSERGTVVVSQATSPLRLISPRLTESGSFQFALSTSPGRSYVIQSASVIPPTWVSIRTNVAPTNVLQFEDGGVAGSNRLRLFRAFVAP